jgi:membrane-associated phospholipid phosphatase
VTRRTTIAISAAAGCGVVALLVWLVAFRTNHGQWYDLITLQHLSGLRDTGLAQFAERLAHLCDPAPFAMLGVSVVTFAWILGGLRTALVVTVVVVLPSVITQELKTMLAESRPGSPPLVFVDAASWPSGHATAAMSLALGSVIAAPARLRGLTALLGVGFACIVGAAVVIYGWHLPSDVVGGFAVSGAVAALGVAVLRPVSRPAATTAPQSRSHRATG